MKLLLIGDCRQATANVGSNGLGRTTYDFLNKFKDKENLEIAVFVNKNSQIPWENVQCYDYENEHADLHKIVEFIEGYKPDIVYDFSHFHLLSKNHPEIDVVNHMHDEECDYQPPNCLIGNPWQQKTFKNARIYPAGIDVSKYKFNEKKKDYFSFCGKLEARKGYDTASYVTRVLNLETIFAGPDVEGRANQLSGRWIGEIRNHDVVCDFLGNSKCLFYPSRNDAGGLAIVEAMALGTPTITTNKSGAQYNVVHGKTGFIAESLSDMIHYASRVEELDPEQIRKECEKGWDFNKNFDKIFEQLVSFSKGERW